MPPPRPPGPPVPPPPGAQQYEQPQYGTQQYGTQQYGAQVYGTAPPSNGFAIAALVLGIISILGFWTFGIGIIFGLLAIVFGAVGRKKSKDMVGDGKRGIATAGVVTGVIGVVGGVLFLVALVPLLDDLEIDTDPADGVCDTDRIFQDPDC